MKHIKEEYGSPCNHIESTVEEFYTMKRDGSGDGEELLESGSISPDGESVVDFTVVETTSDTMDTLVRVTGIY